jgi:hypothetical protein
LGAPHDNMQTPKNRMAKQTPHNHRQHQNEYGQNDLPYGDSHIAVIPDVAHQRPEIREGIYISKVFHAR